MRNPFDRPRTGAKSAGLAKPRKQDTTFPRYAAREQERGIFPSKNAPVWPARSIKSPCPSHLPEAEDGLQKLHVLLDDLLGLVSVVAFAEDLGFEDLVGLGRVGPGRIASLESAEHLHALDHAAENRVLAIQISSRYEG